MTDRKTNNLNSLLAPSLLKDRGLPLFLRDLKRSRLLSIRHFLNFCKRNSWHYSKNFRNFTCTLRFHVHNLSGNSQALQFISLFDATWTISILQWKLMSWMLLKKIFVFKITILKYSKESYLTLIVFQTFSCAYMFTGFCQNKSSLFHKTMFWMSGQK